MLNLLTASKCSKKTPVFLDPPLQELTRPKQGLFYRIVSSKGTTIGHLFGTIHSARAEVNRLSTQAWRAFLQAERFICESPIPINDNNPTANVKSTLVDTGYLSNKEYRYLKSMLKEKYARMRKNFISRRVLTKAALNRMDYWQVLFFLQLSIESDNRYLDNNLLYKAMSCGIPVSYLESAEGFSERLLFQFTPDLAAKICRILIRHPALVTESEQRFEPMVTAFIHNDLHAMVTLMLSPTPSKILLSDSDRMHYEIFSSILNKELLTIRDEKFSRVIIENCQGNTNTFYAFGCGHLPGVIRYLKENNFSVFEVEQGERSRPLDLVSISDIVNLQYQLGVFNLYNPPAFSDYRMGLLGDDVYLPDDSSTLNLHSRQTVFDTTKNVIRTELNESELMPIEGHDQVALSIDEQTLNELITLRRDALKQINPNYTQRFNRTSLFSSINEKKAFLQRANENTLSNNPITLTFSKNKSIEISALLAIRQRRDTRTRTETLNEAMQAVSFYKFTK